MATRFRAIPNPLGVFLLIEREDGTLHSTWRGRGEQEAELETAIEDSTIQPELVARLVRYFDGEPETFDDVAVPPGGSFYRRCWKACREIPAGETRSYGELAAAAGGQNGSARAAGQAMRHNPLPVITPCHRVVAADGSLHGFAGSREAGGPELSLKRQLLELERIAAGVDERDTASLFSEA